MNIRLLLTTTLLALTGRTQNTLIMVASQQNQIVAAAQKVAPNCFLSAAEQKKYLGATPILTRPNGVDIPQKAKDARVDGCAGVEFQLDQSGYPRNLKTVKEYPLDYAFGDALINTLKVEKFMTVADLNQWFYVSTAMISSTINTPQK